MSTAVVIAIAALVLLAGVGVVAAARRSDTDLAIGQLSRETRRRDRGKPGSLGEAEAEAEAAPVGGREYEASARQAPAAASVEVEHAVAAQPPAPFVAPDPELVSISRRQFFNRSIVASMGLSLAGFGASAIAFIWPTSAGGFGSRMNLGPVAEVKAAIQSNSGFLYVPEGRMWVTEFPEEALTKAEGAYSAPELNGMKAGLVALWQTCPHLGCRVPQCLTSQWFECGCHGSQYNRVGEYKRGPAPRGLDRFAMEVDSGGNFIVDTGVIISGPPKGTNTTGQEAEGPNCISSAGGH